MIHSEIILKNSFDSDLKNEFDFDSCVLIYDQILEKKYKSWIRRFPRRMKVRSGEGLKDLTKFPKHMKEIVKLSQGISLKDIRIVAMGGGSVGDFAGFVASIYKRGVELIHIPTTWLSAIDSAHGGKTALNVGGVKNQVGTFYPASKIYLVKEVFQDQPTTRITEALGEYYKIGLIQGGQLWKKMCANPAIDADFLWQLLPAMILAKMKVVQKDPLEQMGYRHILNLGHTIGHVLESELGLAHGSAVLYGLRFAHEFGLQKKLTKKIAELDWMLPTTSDLRLHLRKVRNYEKLISADKKTAGKKQIRFVFITSPGNVFAKQVSISDVLKEWKRLSK